LEISQKPFKHDFNYAKRRTKEHGLGWLYSVRKIRNQVKPSENDLIRFPEETFSEEITSPSNQLIVCELPVG
jgi:hypothetical protein